MSIRNCLVALLCLAIGYLALVERNFVDRCLSSDAASKKNNVGKVFSDAAAAAAAVLDEIEIDLNKAKKIAYISMGEAKNYNMLRERFEKLLDHNTFRFFYHSYDEDCDGCVFQHKTSASEGRNLAVKAAIDSKDYESFKYFVIFDDDLYMSTPLRSTDHPPGATKPKASNKAASSNEEYAWQTYHEMILAESTTHPFIKPMFDQIDVEAGTTTFQSCTDDNFWTIRRDQLGFLYPFSTYEKELFWINPAAWFHLFEKCYPAGFLVDGRWSVSNPSHRYAIDFGGYLDHRLFERNIKEMLDMEYPMLGPWKVKKDILSWQRCTVKELPSLGMHPLCKQATHERFQKWVSGEFKP
jgi:hypothetical protein